mmetsp:Transcript_73806/g.144867  ORF Transcript_73806/g.144867 Transcript_73806/m.144867 type:complete len:225 (-) Transcript_73806:214-888(-)|eukprot:CAMPEP_0170236880 /NCGR_PEP_ID=MMETSP0116_2-20130129/18189_1 /TAXON_ID=400756 /ORGANISM="Durinskia baltica, Strain CSIRO CS-38" /LENGTH=224 /DNA_ID=CAMNT_0010487681 /DNA_START=59 /DNA_END=733 /DNA_ORIENTATION=+
MATSQTKPLIEGRDENGVPLKSDYDGMCPAPNSLHVLYTKLFFIFASVGVAIGFGLWHFAMSKLVREKIGVLAHYELGPLYFGLFALKYTFQMISANMGTARRACKINLPDQHVYRVFGGPANGATVLMDPEGAFGEFNRAQRALANLEELLPLFLVEVAVVGFVFPLFTTAVVIVFSIARFIGARGYTSSVKGRMSGNITSMLVAGMLDGMLFLIGGLAIHAR